MKARGSVVELVYESAFAPLDTPAGQEFSLEAYYSSGEEKLVLGGAWWIRG